MRTEHIVVLIADLLAVIAFAYMMRGGRAERRRRRLHKERRLELRDSVLNRRGRS